MNKKAVWLIAVLVLLIVIVVVRGASHNGAVTSTQPIKIGQMSGLTGIGSDIGVDEKNGALLAVEQINQAGGIAGRQLQMISEDAPNFDLKAGASAAQKLEAVDQVLAIIGPQWDTEGGLMATFSGTHKIPVISQNVSTDIESSVDSPYFFVTWPDDEVGIKNVLSYAQSKGFKKIAIIEPGNYSFWLFTANLFKKNAPAYGINIVDTELNSDFSNVDYRTLIAKAKAAKPDAMFGTFEELECSFLKQAQGQGLNVPLLSTDSAGNPKALSECADQLQGRLFYTTMNRGNGYDGFSKAFAERFGHEPITPSAATAYNAVMTLADVLKNLAGSGTPITRDSIQQGLRTVDYKGAVSIGEIKFNEKGYVVTPPAAYEMRTVKDGAFVKAN